MLRAYVSVLQKVSSTCIKAAVLFLLTFCLVSLVLATCDSGRNPPAPAAVSPWPCAASGGDMGSPLRPCSVWPAPSQTPSCRCRHPWSRAAGNPGGWLPRTKTQATRTVRNIFISRRKTFSCQCMFSYMARKLWFINLFLIREHRWNKVHLIS